MRMPYVDMLISGRGRTAGSEVFARHLHWGLWPSIFRGYRIRDGDMVKAMEDLDDAVVDGARLKDGMTVADIGCGFGGTLSRIAIRMPKANLVGVNFDPRQLALAVPSRATFLCADGSTLPLADDSVDGMLAVECIFHFPSRQKFLAEAERVMKPGARLSISDFVPVSTRLQNSRVGRFVVAQIAKGYGHLADWPDGHYDDMAKNAGLVLESRTNVSYRTVPTYAFMLRSSLTRSFGGQEREIIVPTAVMTVLALVGVLRYELVVFAKP